MHKTPRTIRSDITGLSHRPNTSQPSDTGHNSAPSGFPHTSLFPATMWHPAWRIWPTAASSPDVDPYHQARPVLRTTGRRRLVRRIVQHPPLSTAMCCDVFGEPKSFLLKQQSGSHAKAVPRLVPTELFTITYQMLWRSSVQPESAKIIERKRYRAGVVFERFQSMRAVPPRTIIALEYRLHRGRARAVRGFQAPSHNSLRQSFASHHSPNLSLQSLCRLSDWPSNLSGCERGSAAQVSLATRYLPDGSAASWTLRIFPSTGAPRVRRKEISEGWSAMTYIIWRVVQKIHRLIGKYWLLLSRPRFKQG